MRLLALLTLGSVALACAPSSAVGTTTVTSSDVSAPDAREAGSRLGGETPAGQLVCRASSIHEGTIELYLDWKNGSATGVLRRKAPSGNLSETKVHADRVKGAIIADDVLSQDLVVHAAMVREHKGRTYVRLGDWKQGWTPCDG